MAPVTIGPKNDRLQYVQIYPLWLDRSVGLFAAQVMEYRSP